MRHRAPTPLSRLLHTARTRRGAAIGAAVLLGSATAVSLAAVGGGSTGPVGQVLAEAQQEERDGTSYPGEAALDTVNASRAPATTRGQARTRPSRGISATAEPRTASATPVPRTPADAASSPDPAQSRTTNPRASSGAGGGGSGNGSTASPRPAPSDAATAPSAPAPAPGGPDTTAVTQATVGRTWTVALTADSTTTSFECSLDGAAYTYCAPLAVFDGLGNGRHTLSARAVDATGTVDPSPAEVTTNVTGSLR